MSIDTQSLLDKSLPAVIGLVGVFIGGMLTQSQITEREKEHAYQQLKNDTYAEFFEAQRRLKIAEGSPEERAEDLRYYEARLNLVVNAPSEVVGAFANYLTKVYPTSECSNPAGKQLDAEIYLAIREDTLRSYGMKPDPLPKRELVAVVFRCQLPE